MWEAGVIDIDCIKEPRIVNTYRLTDKGLIIGRHLKCIRDCMEGRQKTEQLSENDVDET